MQNNLKDRTKQMNCRQLPFLPSKQHAKNCEIEKICEYDFGVRSAHVG